MELEPDKVSFLVENVQNHCKNQPQVCNYRMQRSSAHIRAQGMGTIIFIFLCYVYFYHVLKNNNIVWN